MIGLSTANNNFKYNTSELRKEIDSLSSSYANSKKSIEDSAESKKTELTYAENLKNILSEMIDVNGRVKDGYQERAKIILGQLSDALGQEYKLTENGISINGKLVGSYEEIEKAIDDKIQAMKKEIELEASKTLLTEAISQEAKARREVAKAQENLNEKIAKYNENPWNIIDAQAVNEANDALKQAQQNLSEASDDVQEFNKEFTDKMVQSTGEFSAQMIEQGQISKDTLITMAREQSNTFLAELDKMDEGNQALYLGMVTTADTMSPQIIEKWKELASKSEGEYLGNLSMVDADTKATILSAITTTENMTENMAMTWSSLATESKDDFNKALAPLPDDVKSELLASIANVTGLDTTSREAYKNLSANAKAEFNKAMESLPEDAKAKVLAEIIAVDGLTENNRRTYESLSLKGKQAFNTAMNGMDTDARNKIQSAINAINGQSGQMYNAGYNDGKSVKDGANDGQNSNGGSRQIGNWFVQGLLNALTGGRSSIWQAGYNLVKSAINGGNKAQRTGSPAKETIKMGNFFTEGYIVGLKKKQEEVRKTTSGLVGIALNEFKELNEGIKINTKDFEINTNQHVNYSAIKGQILTQSQVNINENIANKIAEAVTQSMKNAEVNVNIEARTDEGVIFKKVQNSAREYTMQTGEPAFGF